MSELEALEARLTAAMDRIRNASHSGRQALRDAASRQADLQAEIDDLKEQLNGARASLAEKPDAAPSPDQGLLDTARAEAEELARGLAEEKARVSSLEEQLAHIRSEVDSAAAQNVQSEGRIRLRSAHDAGQGEDHLARITQLESALEQMKAANAQLRVNNAALRQAHTANLPDATLINAGLEAELDALRAARAADRAEIDSVLAALEPLMQDPASAKEPQDA